MNHGAANHAPAARSRRDRHQSTRTPPIEGVGQLRRWTVIALCAWFLHSALAGCSIRSRDSEQAPRAVGASRAVCCHRNRPSAARRQSHRRPRRVGKAFATWATAEVFLWSVTRTYTRPRVATCVRWRTGLVLWGLLEEGAISRVCFVAWVRGQTLCRA